VDAGRTVVVLGPKRIHGVSDDPSGITSALNGHPILLGLHIIPGYFGNLIGLARE
jgi:hypothetical protein